jgi:hypothetical protein
MAQYLADIQNFFYEYFFFLTVGALFCVFAFLFSYLGEQEAPMRRRREGEGERERETRRKEKEKKP